MKHAKLIVVVIPFLASACLSDTPPERPKLAYTPHFAHEGFKMARRPIAEPPPLAYAASTTYSAAQISALEPAAGQGFMRDDTYQQETFQRRAALSSDKIPAGCDIGDRFDRTETVAYQWGQNRVGLTYDTKGTDFEGAMFRYRLKFQPHQTSKERCRYKSSWQGLVGSSYNEFFLRKNNTVWKDLKAIRLDAQSRLETLMQD